MMELSTPSVVYPLELSRKFRESFHNNWRRPILGRALSFLKVPTGTFTIKNLLRHYAKQAFKHGEST